MMFQKGMYVWYRPTLSVRSKSSLVGSVPLGVDRHLKMPEVNPGASARATVRNSRARLPAARGRTHKTACKPSPPSPRASR